MLLIPDSYGARTSYRLWEGNDCHNPAGAGGGQFCSKSGRDLHQAQHLAPGQPLDLRAAAEARMASDEGTTDRALRRFLFNPATREVVLGKASGVPGRDRSHAEALALAEGYKPGEAPWVAARRYDEYQVHGHLQVDFRGAEPGTHPPLQVIIDRIIPPFAHTRALARSLGQQLTDVPVTAVDASDKLAQLAARLVGLGATKHTKLLARETHKGRWTTFGKAFPELFPKRMRRQAA